MQSSERLSRYASQHSLASWQVVSKPDSPSALPCVVRVLEGAPKGDCWNQSWRRGGLDCTLLLMFRLQRDFFRRCSQLQVMSQPPYKFDMCPPKIRNKIQHAVTGNWCTKRPWQKPHHKSHLWASSFTLYNGMLVFDFRDRGSSFEVYAYRRGQYFLFCSDQSSSPKLYKSLRNAITAKRGEPGCRRHQKDHLLHCVMSGMRVGSCGNENRDAFGGHSHRGFRSQEATNRRIQKRNDRRRDARQSYRAYAKGLGRDEADHGLLQPPPPQPKQAVYDRSKKLLKSSGCATNNASISRAVLSTAIAPCKFRSSALKLASWNVEGLREIAKYDQVFAFMQKHSIHILAMQETHSQCSQEFSKSGYLVLHSSSPQAPKHGVGFIIAPCLRPYVHSFLPLGPRLCSILVSTSPKPLHILCAYAPSMVQDAAEDKRRKTEFWDHFQDYLGTVESPQQLIILGDFNSRLDNGLDESQVHVGPHVWGKRLSVDTPDRDNALQLLETLQGFDLKLPQTYMSIPHAQRVTYKETTCADHLLERPQVSEWTTLDYVITSLEPAFEVASIRSFFQQAANSRHLPLVCTLELSLIACKPLPKPQPPPDFSRTSEYYESLETSLLELCGHSLTPPVTPDGHVLAYTDGSCPNNQVISASNPAGWGFVVSPIMEQLVLHPIPTAGWVSSQGRVRANPDSAEYAGAAVASNNTAELQALLELFDYLLYYAMLPIGQTIHVYTDSQYAADILHGDSLPATHLRLVSNLQKYWVAMRVTYNVSVNKVPGHAGVAGNEYADRVAMTGVYSCGKTGRFAQTPTGSLQPPAFNLDMSRWEAMSVNEQNLFLRDVIERARKLVPLLPLSPHKPWISRETLNLVADLRDSTRLSPAQVKEARKQIKASARRDKKVFVRTKLAKDYESNPTQWTTVRQLKREYKPKSPALRDQDGKLRPKSRRADIFRRYLSKQVWNRKPSSMGPRPPLHPAIPAVHRPFTEEELSACLKRLNTGRAPGPDGIPAELIKRAPFIVRMFLLAHYNKCLAAGTVPEAWLLSEVVMLLKDSKGDQLSVENYRPISLTDVFYKIYASLLQQRLAHYIDPRIRETQFGFRRGRSTSQPIHILRRIIETHERQDSPLHVLFVDWAKAFDSVSFSSIEQSLLRLGVPDPFVKAIMAIYSAPRFRVKDSGVTSGVEEQSRGVRQGCPLSPYLFDIVLTCLFHDVEKSYEQQYGLLAGVLALPSRLWDLEFADDTVLISRSFIQLNRLLHLLQSHALQIGLTLNFDKCKHLPIHSQNRVAFAPNTLLRCQCHCCCGAEPLAHFVPIAQEVKYLGVFIDALGSGNSTVSKRVSRAVSTSKQLKPFMSHKGLPTKWKLIVYKSIILSILGYAMESVYLPPAQERRLNSIHFQNMRRIFGLKSSYFHKVIQPTDTPCSHAYISQLANQLVQIPTPAQYCSFRRLKLLGHVLRHPDSYEFTSTFMQSRAYRFVGGSNRRGRPRPHWAESAMAEAYIRLRHQDTAMVPPVADIRNTYWQTPSIQAIKHAHNADKLPWMDNTLIYRRLNPVAQDRMQWQSCFSQPRFAPAARNCLG